jgi:hypothetical protein
MGLWRNREWANASNPQEVGALMVRWLEGDLKECPTYGGRPDPETLDDPALLAALKAANRAGFITIQSQPGFDGPVTTGGRRYRRWRQRAFVDLFCPRGSQRSLTAAMGRAGLKTLTGREGLPIFDRDGRQEGGSPAPDAWDDLGLLSHKAVSAIADTTIGMSIVDLEWGRNSVLWPTFTRYLLGAVR